MSVFLRLIFHSGPWAGQEVVTPVPMLRIGSDPSKNDIVIEDDMLADAHCIVQRSPRGEYILEDLSQLSQSMMVNGHQFAETDTAIYLSPGDRFHVGISEIEVADANPRLLQTFGEHAGREITLGEQLLSFGRAPDNAVVLDDSEASIYHAVIRCTSLGFSLEDQRSTNGTFINGKQVSSHMLCDGDAIKLGHQEFLFLADERDVAMDAPGDRGTRRMDEVRAYFLLLAGGQRGEHIELGSLPVLIGSAPDCDFELTDPDAALAHCRIIPAEEMYYLEHLGSAYSKTLLNGRALGAGSELLHPGDLLSIGSSVAEFRAVGGVASETGLTMVMTSVIAAGAYDLTPQAKYIVNGHVEMGTELSIGSSPTCHLHLDGEDIGAMHCRIRYAGGFYLEDTSVHGTYLSDTRIVREELQSGHVIRVGRELIDVTIHGERCTLDVIDRHMAMAAIEVAHETAFDLKLAELDQANMGGGAGNAYKTIYKLDFADVESLVRERKGKFHEGAPTWRPSTDIDRPKTIRVGILLTMLTAMALAFFGYQRGETTNLLVNHPLSESHSSVAFAQQASELQMDSDCRACHSAGSGVRAELCVRCHEAFDGSIREQHLSATTPGKGKHLPGTQCFACHREHSATPRFLQGKPSLLGAAQGCVARGCHENQHSDRNFDAEKAGPSAVKAGPVPDFDTPLEEFHISHATIELEGKHIAVSCTTCHAQEDENGELVERNPGKACFGCHSGGGAEVASQCLSCHESEHGSNHGFVRLDEDSALMVGITTPVTPTRSLFWASLILGALFAPALLFGMFLRLRAKSAANRVVAKLKEVPLETVKHLVHSLNREKCVGCHACVQACPTSVLELVNHKTQVVNFDACIQCKACANSCAFGALVMHDADKPPPTIKTPDLDGSLQTPVPGLYLIGQAAGIPQVKNAINMGRTVIERAMQSGMHAGEGRELGAQVDVLIVGSGPAGLSAALTCGQYGIRALVLEKQPEFAWTIRNFFHRGKPVMAEPHNVGLAGLLPVWDTNREDLLAAWEETIASNALEIQYRQDVTNIVKVGEHFEVTVSDAHGNAVGCWAAARVIIAVGGLGTPRRLGCPGDDLDKVRSALVDPQSFRNQELLVVGGSDSAIEVALALCIQNKVHLSCRSKHFDRAKPRNRELMEEAFAAGSVIPHFVTQVSEVRADSVVLEYRNDGTKIELPNDYVFALIGGVPPTQWLESLGVRYVPRPHSWSPPPTDSMFRQ